MRIRSERQSLATRPYRRFSKAGFAVGCFLLFGPHMAKAEIVIPLSGPAYHIAMQAYQAYSHHAYSTAIIDAREAVRQRPDVGRLRLLLIKSLIADGQIAAARQEAKKAAEDSLLLPSTRAQFRRLEIEIGRLRAFQPFDPAYLAARAAYAALAHGDNALAVTEARRAVALKPSVERYRALLITALLKNDRPDQALAVIKLTLAHFGPSRSLLEQAGMLASAMGNQAEAYQDFAAALKLSSPTDETRILRFSLADAALATSHPQEALNALAPLGNGPDYEVWIRRGYAWKVLKVYDDSETAFINAQQSASTEAERDQAIMARINLLLATHQTGAARRIFLNSYKDGLLRTINGVSLGYFAILFGEKQLAYAELVSAYKQGELHGGQLVDAAYTALRTYHNGVAIDLFKHAIDDTSLGTYQLSQQNLFNLRREVANVSRVWGANITLNYGSSPTTISSALSPGQSDHILQLGSEIYWQPPGIGYQNGRIFRVFTRNFVTIADSRHGATGVSTFQNSVGASWKPFSRYNLVLEASQLFKLNRNSRNDTLLRIATSGGEGTDLQINRSSWTTYQYYGELARYLKTNENIADGEVRLGRSYRINSINPDLVFTPFVGASATFDNYYSNNVSLGIGPGLNARYWFNQTKYSAPASYVDFTLQYRFGITGGNENHGIFVGLTFAY